MRKLIAIIIIASFAIASPALAQSTNTNTSSSSSGASSGSTANIYTKSKGSKIPKGVGNAVAPGLIAGGLTCQGSVSGGIGGQGFAVAFGATKMDKDCNTRENAKVIYMMGYKSAGVEVMCNIAEVREAMALTGTPCMRDRVARVRYQQNTTVTKKRSLFGNKTASANFSYTTNTAYGYSGKVKIKKLKQRVFDTSPQDRKDSGR